MEQCSLTANWFAKFVQLALGVLCFLALLVKRHREEEPKRSTKVWLMDTSKQVFSSGCAHLAGIIIATFMNGIEDSSANECAWYFITFSLDTTLGVSLAYVMVRAQDAVVERGACHCLGKTGDYGDPEDPDWQRYFLQSIIWCIVTVAARMFVGLTMYTFRNGLSLLAHGVAVPFEGHPHLFLVLVMIGCPLCMNIIQLWVQDTFLKKVDDSSGDGDYLGLDNPSLDPLGSDPPTPRFSEDSEAIRMFSTPEPCCNRSF